MEIKDEDYIINVGPKGTFQRSGAYQTLPQQVDAIFSRWESEQVRDVTLFFHGGLVSEKSGLGAARNIAPHIVNADSTPVCFVWETGLVETLTSNISKLGETSLFQSILKFLLKKVTQKIGLDLPSGRGDGQGLSDAEIEQELEKPEPFTGYDHWVTADSSRGEIGLEALTALLQTGQLEEDISSEIQNEIEQDYALYRQLSESAIAVYDDTEEGERGFLGAPVIIFHIAKVAYKIILRFIRKTDHGLYPTIIEEILRKFYIAEVGAWVWKAMKDKSEAMWNSNEGRTGHQQYAGRYFLDRLADYVSRYPQTKVNLIGHSAGSIAICNLFGHSLLKFNHILLLAPACRTELFTERVLSAPERFADLRIFTMSNENECRDTLVPFFYTRSLLYLISGILEDKGESSDAPILGLERHIAFRSPYNSGDFKDVHEYLYEQGKDRLCYAVTLESALDGLRTHSRRHGDFDNDERTLSSITYILAN